MAELIFLHLVYITSSDHRGITFEISTSPPIIEKVQIHWHCS